MVEHPASINYAGCPQGGQSVSKNGLAIFLHGMPAGQTVSRFWSGIFLHGIPAGQAVSRFGSGISFFFLHGLPAGQSVSRFGSCDVKSSFDLFIKPGLNSLLVAAILFTSFRLNYAVSKRNLTLLKRQMERITSKKHSTVKTVDIGEFLAKESCFV